MVTRRAFNLIELAVVLIIIFVLAALLLAAVPRMHVTAARTVCQNNLKQHGLACHNYADTNGERFPPGTMPNPGLPPEQRFSFHAALLPYVEQEKLHSLLAKSEPWDSDRNVSLMALRPFRMYQCPAWVQFHRYDANLTSSGARAVSNYVGVAGTGADAATNPADAAGNGIFGYDRATALKDVKDGTSNTALMFETSHNLGPWTRGGPSTVRTVGPEGGGFGDTHFRTSWLSGAQSIGFYVLLADATVRHTKPEVDPAILAALATVAGHEEILTDW
jgi:hypothetical protein